HPTWLNRRTRVKREVKWIMAQRWRRPAALTTTEWRSKSGSHRDPDQGGPMSTKMLLVGLAAIVAAAPLVAQQPQIITGLKQPESIAIGPGGKVYVSETGEYDKANDGYISILEGGKPRRFA